MGEDRLKGWDTGPDGGSSIIFSLSLRRGGQLADHRTTASQWKWQGCECEGPRGRAGCPRPCPLQEAFSLQPNTRSHLSSDVHHVIFYQRNCGGALDNLLPRVPLLAWVWCIRDTVNACWSSLFVFRHLTLNWSSGAWMFRNSAYTPSQLLILGWDSPVRASMGELRLLPSPKARPEAITGPGECLPSGFILSSCLEQGWGFPRARGVQKLCRRCTERG